MNRSQFTGLVRLSALVVLAGTMTSSGAIVHTTIAASGAAAPGGGSYASFTGSLPSVNASGQVAIVASLNNGASILIRGNGTTTQRIAAAGDASPLGGTFAASGLATPAINSAGDVAYNANVTGGSAPGAVLRYSNGVNTPLITRGSSTPLGGTYSTFASAGVGINDSDTIAFGANISGGSGSNAVFRSSGGTTTAVFFNGQNVPGAGTLTTQVGNASINNSGQMATFFSSTAGGALLRASSTGVVSPVAITNAASPIGGTYSGFTVPSLNNSGQIVFNASISGGPTSAGIFIADGATISTIATVGASVPGMLGVTFSGLSQPWINDSGVVIFRATLAGTGVTATDDTAYFFGTSASNLTMILREGDTVTIAGSPQVLTGNLVPSSQGVVIGDNGFAWRAQYAGGSAVIYTSDPRFNIPAPGAAGLLLASGLLTARRRR